MATGCIGGLGWEGGYMGKFLFDTNENYNTLN